MYKECNWYNILIKYFFKSIKNVILNYSFLDTSQDLSTRLHNKETQSSSQNRNNWYPNHSVRFIRSARKHLRLRSDIPTTSFTKLERSTSSNFDGTKRERFHRKRMTANHNIGFKMPPHIDKSRSTGNVSVMVGKQLLLTCTIPNTGNESVSLKDFLELIQPFCIVVENL